MLSVTTNSAVCKGDYLQFSQNFPNYVNSKERLLLRSEMARFQKIGDHHKRGGPKILEPSRVSLLSQNRFHLIFTVSSFISVISEVWEGHSLKFYRWIVRRRGPKF